MFKYEISDVKLCCLDYNIFIQLDNYFATSYNSDWHT